MTVTAGEMVDETIGLLQSFNLDSEQMTTLANDFATGTLTFNVAQTRGIALGISPGIIEMGQELMYCDTVGDAGACTVVPWGRGYKSTPISTHLAGSRVTSQPTFPRYWVMKALNETLERIFPDVSAINVVETTVTYPSITYPLPAGTQRVLDARWLVPDGAQYWEGVHRWRMSAGGGTLLGDTGVSVDILDPMLVGQPLMIRVMTKPDQMVSETDDFESTTGLNVSLRDVICLGAAASLTTSQELSRLQTSSIEQQNRSQLVGPSAALTSSNFLQQRFNARLAEERKTQQVLYPLRITGGWI